MKTATKTKKPKTRSFRLTKFRPDSDGPAMLTMTIGKEVTPYYFRIHSDGVEFLKVGEKEASDVMVPDSGPVTCDCRGFTSHQHCKHADLAPRLICEVARRYDLETAC